MKWSEVKWRVVQRSEVKWRVVKRRGIKRGVPWRVRMGSEVNWSEGHVKIGVQYLRSNNIRNSVQYFLPLVLLFLCALLLTVVGLLCIGLIFLGIFLILHVYCFTVLCVQLSYRVLTLAAYQQDTKTLIESDGTICCLCTTMSSWRWVLDTRNMQRRVIIFDE